MSQKVSVSSATTWSYRKQNFVDLRIVKIIQKGYSLAISRSKVVTTGSFFDNQRLHSQTRSGSASISSHWRLNFVNLRLFSYLISWGMHVLRWIRTTLVSSRERGGGAIHLDWVAIYHFCSWKAPLGDCTCHFDVWSMYPLMAESSSPSLASRCHTFPLTVVMRKESKETWKMWKDSLQEYVLKPRGTGMVKFNPKTLKWYWMHFAIPWYGGRPQISMPKSLPLVWRKGILHTYG